MKLFLHFQNKTYSFDSINPCISIYHFKNEISKKLKIHLTDKSIIDLEFNNKRLNNNISLFQYGIKDNDTLECYLPETTKGGIDVLTVLFFIGIVLLILIFCGIKILGFIPFMANTFFYLIEWCWNWIKESLGFAHLDDFIEGKTSTNFNIRFIRPFIRFFGIIFNVLKTFSIYFFVYVISALLIFPILYYRNFQFCPSLQVADWIGFTVSIIFIVFYVIMKIPNYNLALVEKVSKSSYVLSTTLDPFVKFLEQIANVSKFDLVYAIPIVGTPLLMGYHTAVSAVMSGIYGFASQADSMVADTQAEFLKKIEKYNQLFKNYENIPVINEYIDSYGLKNMMDVMEYLTNPNKVKKYENIIVENDIHWYHFLLYSLPLGGWFNGLISKIFGFFSTISKWIRRLTIGNVEFDEDKINVNKDGSSMINGERLDQIVQKYYLGSFIGEVSRIIVYFMNQIKLLFDYQGTTMEIQDSIRVSSISGILSSIALIVILILSFFLSSMYGISFA